MASSMRVLLVFVLAAGAWQGARTQSDDNEGGGGGSGFGFNVDLGGDSSSGGLLVGAGNLLTTFTGGLFGGASGEPCCDEDVAEETDTSDFQPISFNTFVTDPAYVYVDPPQVASTDTVLISDGEGGFAAAMDANACNSIDTSSISSAVRSAVRADNIPLVATLCVASGDVVGLGKGFRFSPEAREEELIRTAERFGDGDVISFKGIAKAALLSGDAEKLANVILVAITPPGCSFPENVDPLELKNAIREDLSNFDLMLSYLNADPTNQFIPSTGRRRLTCNACSPVNSWVCAHCWPAPTCSKCWWCDK